MANSNKPQKYTATYTQEGAPDITLETGWLARQSNGAILLHCGQATLLATVVTSKDAREGVDFLPLTVDYQEKFAASGRFPGGFIKRESRLSEYEILISRLVDRALRPTFPGDYHAELQVNINLVSADPEVMPDALAAFAASACITVSDIPFNGPLSEVRVIELDGEFIVNPSRSQLDNATMDLIVAGSYDSVNMVEGEADEASEEAFIEAIKAAHRAIQAQCQVQLDLREQCGKPKFEYRHEYQDEALRERCEAYFPDRVREIAQSESAKKERSRKFEELMKAFLEQQTEEPDSFLLKKYYGEIRKREVRKVVLESKRRLDGRAPEDIRPIWCDINVLPSPHGSAVFTRGETQSLTTVTLGSSTDEQTIDGVTLYDTSSRFYLHYNFPGYSTGEVKPNRGPARREVGHGHLAQRALFKAVDDEGIPYTVRIVSDILESNGSSSMATVCAGSLALFDAGIKMKGNVSGIAMGLIQNGQDDYAILSDILGDEDALGDMDFKVAGTQKGITACQMDIKISGISYERMTEALQQAQRGRQHILDILDETIPGPREDYKPHVPRIERFTIDKDFIGAIIGPGGKIIQGIQADTGATVSIEEIEGKGHIEIMSSDKDSMEAARKKILGLIEQPEAGKVYTGIVKDIKDFGAFVEILPGKDGLLHISEITWERLPSMDGVLEVGDEVEVKLVEVDPRSGKLRLSRKQLVPRPEGFVEAEERPRGGGGGDRRGGGRGNDRDRRGGGGRGGDRDRRSGNGGGRRDDR